MQLLVIFSLINTFVKNKKKEIDRSNILTIYKILQKNKQICQLKVDKVKSLNKKLMRNNLKNRERSIIKRNKKFLKNKNRLAFLLIEVLVKKNNSKCLNNNNNNNTQLKKK